MLVLTRKSREQIQIGDNVVITILRVKGQAVRIGVEAPRDVRVLRSELPKNEDEPAAVPAPETVVATPTAETSVAHTPLRRSTRTHSAHQKSTPRHKASPVWTPAPTPATLSVTIKSETKPETAVTMFGTATTPTAPLALHRQAAAVRSSGSR